MFTGGKDSTYALHKAIWNGYRVAVLSSVIPLYKHSMLYHQPSPSILQAQAYSLGIPVESIGVNNPDFELNALRILLARVRDKYGVRVVVAGAISSRYQKERFSSIAGELGLELYTPLWGMDPSSYLREVISNGIKFTIASITSMGIPMELLGKEIDLRDAEKLIALSEKYGFNPSFEGGDAETIVVDAPLFKYRLYLTGVKRIVSEYEGFFEPSRVKLVKKLL